jgi:hypothetical protein
VQRYPVCRGNNRSSGLGQSFVRAVAQHLVVHWSEPNLYAESCIVKAATKIPLEVSRLDRFAIVVIAIAGAFVLIFGARISPWVVAGMLVLGLQAWRTGDFVYVKIAVVFVLALQVFTYCNEVVVRLTPHTIDAQLEHLDHGMGKAFSDWWRHSSIATVVVKIVYQALPLPIAIVLAFTEQRRAAIRAYVVSSLLAMPCYLMFPATGPAWVGTSAPRNCMPSFHFIWAILAWWYSPRWLRIPNLAVALLVAAATLVLREHYILDLVVAIPFAAALIGIPELVSLSAASRSARRLLVEPSEEIEV